MKKHSQPIDSNSGKVGPMLSKSDFEKFADSLWMPSVIEDSHFEEMRKQRSQKGIPKRHIDDQNVSQ